MTPQQSEPARVKLAAWRTVQQSGLGETKALANAEEAVMQELAELETTWLDRALQQGRERDAKRGNLGASVTCCCIC